MPNSIPLKVNSRNNVVTAILIKKSFFIVDFFIISGIIIKVTPNTISVLKILDPNTFPTAISLFPWSDDIILTASSGALVPNDTIVNPTITDGIPNFLEILEAPSTKISAPFISRKNPIINNM